MEITTITTIPPQITQYFDRWLLIPWEKIYQQYRRIVEKTKHKIRPCDTSRRKEFDDWCEAMEKIYVQAKIMQEKRSKD